MTYYKYTVLGVFCFIPGKVILEKPLMWLFMTDCCVIQVLDECYRVLREVVVHKNPPKSYELLQELRDISSMAMEHFEEHIVPTMKRNQLISSAIRNNSSSPRFIRCVADPEDSDGESSLPSTSSSSGCIPHLRPLGSFVRSSCGGTPTATSVSNLKIELVVQQHQMLINSQKRQIFDLKTKVFS